MIDKTRPPKAQRDPLPPFLPVPRERERHDGWTPERQRLFIEALADTGSVKAAAHAVNMTPEGAYLLRRHPEGGPFRKAWEKALKLGVQRLEDVAMERALHGVDVPVYHFGAVVGTRRVHNDRLLMFLLRNRAGKRFSADGRHDAVTRGELRKLEAQWREDWENEQAAKAPSLEEIRASLRRKMQDFYQQAQAIEEGRAARCSPRTQRLKRAYHRMLERDERLLAANPDHVWDGSEGGNADAKGGGNGGGNGGGERGAPG